MQYKLIKKYPGLPENIEEGDIVIKNAYDAYHLEGSKSFYKEAQEIENFPEFWKKIELKNYLIPVSWECSGEIKVEANSLEEALQYASDIVHIFGLPNGIYVEDSFKIDTNIEFVEPLKKNS